MSKAPIKSLVLIGGFENTFYFLKIWIISFLCNSFSNIFIYYIIFSSTAFKDTTRKD